MGYSYYAVTVKSSLELYVVLNEWKENFASALVGSLILS